MNYEAVIGLEVHVQVKTHSKVFTRVATGYGHEPNTPTDPVVLGLPGALPVMNKGPEKLFLSGLAQELPNLAIRSADLHRWRS